MPINSFLYPGAKFIPGYEVANSCRFEEGRTTSLSRTLGTPTTANVWTFSCWVKKSKLGDYQNLLAADVSGSGHRDCIRFQNDDKLTVFFNELADGEVKTNRAFRDPSAWLNIVVAVDTTQATDTNRVKIYVNGTQETSLATSSYPAEDYTCGMNTNDVHRIGRDFLYTEYFDGYLAEVCFIDGQQLTPTSFGEFDEDSPTIWKPKDVSGLTFGDNGAYLDFEDSDNLGDDESGNANDWAENNIAATDQATDTPTNNFATLNPLGFTEGTLSEGNTEIDQNGSAGRFCAGTIQPSNGKWYFEAKVLNYGADPRHFVGVGRNEETYTGTASAGASSIGYSLETQTVFKADSSVLDLSSADSPATDDIYMIAYDIDNLKIYLGKNGTWLNSGDPAGGSGNVTTLVSGTDYAPITGALNASSNSARNNDWQFNFGNPTFTISSGNADADGYGNFEYAVPSGFYALCSKNLAEYG